MVYENPTTPGASLEALLRNLSPGRESVLDLAQELTKDGVKRVSLALGQRAIQPEPPREAPRARSPRRAHATTDVDGFIAYLGKFAGGNLVVLADPGSGSMAAVLDECATEGFEQITFEPQYHPLFAPWVEGDEDADAVIGATTGIKAFVQFIAENRRIVIGPDPKELTLMLSQVRMSRVVELWQGDGNHAVNGIRIKTDIQGQPRDDLVELPDIVTIKCPIYLGTPAVAIEIDLTLLGSEQIGVQVRCVSSDLAVKKADLFQQMLDQVKKELPKATVSTGRVAYGEWACLR